MKNDIYWIWFAMRQGIGSRNKAALLELFGSARDIYECTDFSETDGLDADARRQLEDKSLDEANRAADKTADHGGCILTPEDEEYPFLLRHIADPPLALYVSGGTPWSRERLAIAIVGTRDCDDYGASVTGRLSYELARSGVLIVSGMARGIDGMAASAALDAGGETVAVLGSGLDVIYPREHKKLYDMITENGAVMTEYPPGTPPLKTHFPRRNRIIAGLANGMIVTQAPKRSGALITASCALDFGRDVFAVPGNVFERRNEGSNGLIRDGAKAVLDAEDVVSEYPYISLTPLITDAKKKARYETRNKSKPQKQGLTEEEKKAMTEGLGKTEKAVVTRLFSGKAHIDELSRELGTDPAELGAALIMLEMRGTVKNVGGNIFALAEG